MNAKNIYIKIAACIGLCLAYSHVFAQQNPSKLIVFYSPACHKCLEAKNEVIPAIEKEFLGKIEIEYRNFDDINNYKYLLALREKYNPALEIEVPVFFLRGNFLTGKSDIRGNLKNFIITSLNMAHREEALHEVDLVEFFKRFKLAGIIIAGLEDGINPCAFTVIVFFISYLALQGYVKKALVMIGLAFISTIFVTYFLIGLGIFNFLYALKGFWIVTRTLNICIGLLSIALGVLAVYDFFKFKATKDTEDQILQLPKSIKNRIHAVIGLHYRKPGKPQEGNSNPDIFRLISSAVITGFLVTLLEAVCTGQLYLPTITMILKTTPLKLEALGYLIIYNLMFILPLVIIFLFALLGTTSQQFARFLKRHLGLIKIFMAVLFFILGAFLIWRA